MTRFVILELDGLLPPHEERKSNVVLHMVEPENGDKKLYVVVDDIQAEVVDIFPVAYGSEADRSIARAVAKVLKESGFAHHAVVRQDGHDGR